MVRFRPLAWIHPARAPDAPARNALIAAHLGRLEAELAQTRTAVESLRTPLAPPDGPAVIEHRSVPAAAAAAIGAVVDRADLLACRGPDVSCYLAAAYER